MAAETRRLTGQGKNLATRLFLILSIAVLAGCAGGLSQTTRQVLSVVAPHDVDFEELKFYAERAESAYGTPAQIRKDYPKATRVNTVQPNDVRYFIETDHTAKTQTISVRGTADKPNIWEDIEVALVNDSILGIGLHRGFQNDAMAIWKDAKPHLRKDYEIRTTGHSLGAAVAFIIGGYVRAEGYNLTRMVNFGQPKVTDAKLNPEIFKITTRVIDDRDVVPMLPPPGFVHPYRHAGAEVILRPGEDFVYLDAHDADRITVASFWEEFTKFSVKEHYMKNYIANIDYKLENGARQVPYILR